MKVRGMREGRVCRDRSGRLHCRAAGHISCGAACGQGRSPASHGWKRSPPPHPLCPVRYQRMAASGAAVEVNAPMNLVLPRWRTVSAAVMKRISSCKPLKTINSSLLPFRLGLFTKSRCTRGEL